MSEHCGSFRTCRSWNISWLSLPGLVGQYRERESFFSLRGNTEFVDFLSRKTKRRDLVGNCFHQRLVSRAAPGDDVVPFVCWQGRHDPALQALPDACRRQGCRRGDDVFFANASAEAQEAGNEFTAEFFASGGARRFL